MNFVLCQPHVAILNLITANNRLKRVYQLTSVVPLHVRSAKHHSSLLRTRRFSVYARSPEGLRLLSLSLQVRHHTSLAIDSGIKWIVGDEWACWHANLGVLKQVLTHATLRLLRCFVRRISPDLLIDLHILTVRRVSKMLPT